MEYKDLSPAVQSEEQLRQLIQEKVAAGETSFPSERALENELGVSRTTLRRSLDTLEKEAVIQKRNRKGIEINQKQTINILQMNSMSSQLPGEQKVEVMSQEIVAGKDEVNHFLNLSEDKPVFKLVRRRIVDNKPFSYEISFIDSTRFAGIEKIDLNNSSLYNVLEKQFAIKPTYGREELRFVSANEKLAEALKVPLNTPLFEVIASEIKDSINRDEYKPGMLMPNETALQEIFSSSRTTIRRAVDLLVEEGLVVRKNGVGLYVQPKLTAQNILEMTGVMKTDTNENLKKDIKDFYIRKAGKFYAEKFGIKENELVYSIKFVQKSEHGVTLDRLILPLSLYPDLQAKDFQIINIIELVNSGKYKLFELEQELQLILAGNEQIKNMHIDENDPVFKLSSVFYAENEMPIAIQYHYEDAESTKYVVDFN